MFMELSWEDWANMRYWAATVLPWKTKLSEFRSRYQR